MSKMQTVGRTSCAPRSHQGAAIAPKGNAMTAKGWYGAAVFGLFLCATAHAADLKDVPKGFWARSAVQAVVDRGIMTARNGKFAGDTAVTRTEMAVILARFAKSLEQGRWTKAKPRAVDPRADAAKAGKSPVTRYELAAVLARVADFTMQGLPQAAGKTFNASEALPPAVKLTGVDKSNAAYEALVYLT